MIRQIIKIEEDKCNGCGLCVNACHEGALGIVDGKARLLKENYCDGLGNCLPECPMNAISFEMREAPGYDEQAVLEAKRKKQQELENLAMQAGEVPSFLDNWPIQVHLVSPSSPSFYQCDLLVAADCAPFAYGNFHKDFIKGRTVVIGCPKQDGDEFAQKLIEIVENNDIKSITVVRMFVPCCSAMEFNLYQAIGSANKEIPIKIITIGAAGEIIDE